MDGVTIAGALVATTSDIKRIKYAAEVEGREYELTWDTISRLDPDGNHILCTRHPADTESIEGWGREGPSEKQGRDYWSGTMTLGTLINFEGLFKYRGQKAPVTHWISLTIREASQLEAAPSRTESRTVAIDGETQVR